MRSRMRETHSRPVPFKGVYTTLKGPRASETDCAATASMNASTTASSIHETRPARTASSKSMQRTSSKGSTASMAAEMSDAACEAIWQPSAP